MSTAVVVFTSPAGERYEFQTEDVLAAYGMLARKLKCTFEAPDFASRDQRHEVWTVETRGGRHGRASWRSPLRRKPA
jgi:hypothetical protein